jgi:hypothetical protein
MKLRLLVITALVFAGLGAVNHASQKSVTAMTDAANKFLGSLTAEQKARATFAFADEERMRWHFIPNEMFPRKGLTIKEMTEPQRQLAHALLKTGVSQKGYLAVTQIMSLEDILKVVENANGRFARNKEEYYFSVFGTPSAKGPWGWRVEGHHVSLRFAVVNGTTIASTPSFLGTNPAEIREGERKGLRVLAAREDTARALVESLDAAQQKTAILPIAAPGDILTMNNNDIKPLENNGVMMSALSAKRKDLLMQVIDAYIGTMEADIASERLAALKSAGLDAVRFAWAGETARGKKHYYRVQGPTFLIEYDNTQNDGNHIHSVWRDFNGDFGTDLLREHLKAFAH